MTTACRHLGQVRNVSPRTPAGCEECLKKGMTWVHLRLCQTCGHVGCCNDSVGKHATKHWHSSKHPLVRSLEPGEDWSWCYADDMVIEPAVRPPAKARRSP